MINLDEHELELVNSSLPVMMANAAAMGDRFYANLFGAYPQLKPLFNHAPGNQGEKLINMLAYIVSCLDNLEELDHVLHQLGKRHMAYKTEPGHYPAVKEVLGQTLREFFGNHPNLPGLIMAWGRFYDLVAERMLAAPSSIA